MAAGEEMTTIATDGRTIAADGRITSDYIDTDNSMKLYVVKNDKGQTTEIFGTCGDCDLGEAYREWVMGGKKAKARPEWQVTDGDCFEALHLHPDGVVYYVGGRNFSKIEVNTPVSIGSGALFALSAMKLGLDPAAAVDFAITLDPNSGGKVVSLAIE